MCGIAGILGRTEPADHARVAAMNAIQRHRGPDAGQVVVVPGAVLGHRRLSIIDLSDAGLQPMRGTDGRHVIVFNGEIYNYRELRAELAGDHHFVTGSDTEVLLEAWRRWGEGCLERLNGMFAFCVVDTVTGHAFLARDRFGQKPLFLHRDGGRLLFASEVKALLAAGVRAAPDLDVWSRYLVNASYDDDEGTFFAGVSQLVPGECAAWDPERGLTRRRWYRLAERVVPRTLSVAEAAAEVRDIIVDAARLHMRADVPVAVSLSGGLDSSALLACLDLAGELSPKVACFSVDFGGDFSEARWFKAAAAHHDLSSTVLEYDNASFLAHMRPMMWQLEGPIGGLMNSALALVMAQAHYGGFKVIQDGTGLDEAFAGYRNHHNLWLGRLIASGAAGADRAVAEYAANWGTTPDKAREAALAELARPVTAIDGTVPTRPDLMRPEFLARHAGERPGVDSTGDALKDQLVDYLQVRKVPRNTRFKDRLSMAYGLELRLPFLDHRLIELALSLPSEHYFLHGRSKSILREALAGAMDDAVRIAPKRSIQAPQGLWLRSEPMAGYVESLISSSSFADRGLFQVDKVKAAWAEFKTGKFDNSFFVWQWINVEEWFRTFVDADAVTTQVPLCPELHAVPTQG